MQARDTVGMQQRDGIRRAAAARTGACAQSSKLRNKAAKSTDPDAGAAATTLSAIVCTDVEKGNQESSGEGQGTASKWTLVSTASRSEAQAALQQITIKMKTKKTIGRVNEKHIQ